MKGAPGLVHQSISDSGPRIGSPIEQFQDVQHIVKELGEFLKSTR